MLEREKWRWSTGSLLQNARLTKTACHDNELRDPTHNSVSPNILHSSALRRLTVFCRSARVSLQRARANLQWNWSDPHYAKGKDTMEGWLAPGGQLPLTWLRYTRLPQCDRPTSFGDTPPPLPGVRNIKWPLIGWGKFDFSLFILILQIICRCHNNLLGTVSFPNVTNIDLSISISRNY